MEAAALRRLRAARPTALITRFAALLPRRVSEAIGRLMKADKLMFEVDHGARRAYEERAAASEPGLERGPASAERASATPPERDAA